MYALNIVTSLIQDLSYVMHEGNNIGSNQHNLIWNI